MANQVTSSRFAERINILAANPAAMQRMILRTLEDMTNGDVVIVDPTNPFVFLMEATCSIASAGMLQAEALVQKLYPKRAMTSEDLYRHMSDSDYLNRFDKPGRSVVHVLMDLEEFQQKAVLVPDGSGIRQIVIPKHSEIMVAGIKLTLQYPIQIRLMPHGGIGVFYDTSEISPLYTLETNRIDFKIGRVSNRRFMKFTIPVQEMAIQSQMIQLNNVTGFAKEFDYTDKFFYCRAYTKNTVDSTWSEILVTHSEQVYDVNTPTVIVKVLEGRLSTTLPQIYFNNGTIEDSLRIDIYTTQGLDGTNLGAYKMDAYSANWLDYDTVVNSPYTAPLFTFSGLLLFSDSVIAGTAAGMTLDALRDKVITNGLSNNNLPITNSQLSNAIQNQNFDVVTNLDNVTDRQFLASRALPAPKTVVQNDFNAGTTISPAGSCVLTLQQTLSSLMDFNTVADNGNRMTIKPETLFTRYNGQLKIVDNVTHSGLINLIGTSPESLAAVINQSQFVYTPFYYVLDAGLDLFEVRAYELDTPQITSKFFYAENSALGIPVSTQDYSLVKNPSGLGYILNIVVATSPEIVELALDQLILQLSFVPKGSSTRCVFNGVLVSPIDVGTGRPVDEYYNYHFYLDTNYDVDAEHNLVFEPSGNTSPLANEFDLVYIVKNHAPLGSTVTNIDAVYISTEFDDYDPLAIYRGLSHEKITLEFGTWLEHLWVRSRSAVTNNRYLSYETDVPAIYSADVYLRDSSGNIVIGYDALNNDITTTLLHAQGDPVLTTLGSAVYETALLATPNLTVSTWWSSLSNALRASYQVIAHRAGEHILDAQGNPQLASSVRDVHRQVDLILIDGRYYFATEDATLTYRNEIVNTLVQWVNVELGVLALRLLERSELYYYPKITMGEIEVIVGENEVSRIDAEQSLTITYYMQEDKVNNAELKTTIAAKTAEVIASQLQNSTISTSLMQYLLLKTMGDDIISVTLKGFTNDVYDTITVVDTAKRPSIGKHVVALSNLTLAVRDAINITFLEHLKN